MRISLDYGLRTRTTAAGLLARGRTPTIDSQRARGRSRTVARIRPLRRARTLATAWRSALDFLGPVATTY
jgi:hypothetical protein